MGCGGRLIVRKGKRAHHFAHYVKTAEQMCPSNRKGAMQSDNHKLCKKHVAENLHEYAFCKHHCERCNKWSLYDTSGCTAEVEKKVEGSSRIADVRLTNSSGKVDLTVEILETHIVCKQKHNEMQALGVSVIEVATEEVLQAITNPYKNELGVKYFVKTIDFYRDVCDECTVKLERKAADDEKQRMEERRLKNAESIYCTLLPVGTSWQRTLNGFPMGREAILAMLAPREVVCPKCPSRGYTPLCVERYYFDKYGECDKCHEHTTGTSWRTKEQAIRNKAKRAMNKLIDKGQSHMDDHNFHHALEAYQAAMDVYKNGHRPLIWPDQVSLIAGKIARCEHEIDK
jgi:hypothetical protein